MARTGLSQHPRRAAERREAADGSNAASGSVSLRGRVHRLRREQNAPPTTGSDGYEVKILQPEMFNISVDVPASPAETACPRPARGWDPTPSTGSIRSDGGADPGDGGAIRARRYRDFAPDDPNVNVNNPPVQHRPERPAGARDRLRGREQQRAAGSAGQLPGGRIARSPCRWRCEPDMRLEAAAVAPRSGSPSRLVDLGKLWHGFQTPTWRALQTGAVDAAGPGVLRSGTGSRSCC